MFSKKRTPEPRKWKSQAKTTLPRFELLPSLPLRKNSDHASWITDVGQVIANAGWSRYEDILYTRRRDEKMAKWLLRQLPKHLAKSFAHIKSAQTLWINVQYCLEGCPACTYRGADPDADSATLNELEIGAHHGCGNCKLILEVLETLDSHFVKPRRPVSSRKIMFNCNRLELFTTDRTFEVSALLPEGEISEKYVVSTISSEWALCTDNWSNVSNRTTSFTRVGRCSTAICVEQKDSEYGRFMARGMCWASRRLLENKLHVRTAPRNLPRRLKSQFTPYRKDAHGRPLRCSLVLLGSNNRHFSHQARQCRKPFQGNIVWCTPQGMLLPSARYTWLMVAFTRLYKTLSSFVDASESTISGSMLSASSKTMWPRRIGTSSHYKWIPSTPTLTSSSQPPLQRLVPKASCQRMMWPGRMLPTCRAKAWMSSELRVDARVTIGLLKAACATVH